MQCEQLDPGVAAAKCSTAGQRQGGHGYQNEWQSQSSNHNSPTCTDLWHWMIKHGVSRSEIGSLLNSYLMCISRKVLGRMNNSLTWIIKTESQSILRMKLGYRPRNILEKGRPSPHKEWRRYTAKNYTVNLSPILPQRDLLHFTRVTALGKKK